MEHTEADVEQRAEADVVAVRDGVIARELTGADGVREVIDLLEEAERAGGVPLVDEAERERLDALAAGTSAREASWRSVLARDEGGAAVGYAGVLVPSSPGGPATGDLALAHGAGPGHPALPALLAGLERFAWRADAGDLEVWIRHVRSDDLAGVTEHGYALRRQLGVLGRDLGAGAAPEAEDRAALDVPGITVRAFRPDEDDAGIVEVLAAAYAGTADGGWDLARFAQRRGWSWFDPADLLVAEDEDGSIAGLHWLKRRDEATGEVYNLAIHPDAQGRRLGPLLLAAGLDHLRAVGCREVLLWVDLANVRAVRLYTSQGFTTRWEDVAIARTLRGPDPGSDQR